MSVAAFLAAVLIAATLSGGKGHVSAQIAPSLSPVSVPVSYGPSVSGPAASPPSDCMTNLLNMSDCLSYVMAGSGGGASKPDAGCCPELAGLVESTPQCLCYLLGGDTAEQYGIKIDMAKALKLPAVCGVDTPPPSLCSLYGVPVAAPTANGPTSSSPISPGAQSPQGFAVSPTIGDQKSYAQRSFRSPDIMYFTIILLVSVIYIYQ